MTNEKYFTGIPNIGDLYLDKVLFEDICPIFFTLISEELNRYICVCCELYGEQRWLISPISNSELIRMLKDEISMRDAFLTQNSEKCIVARWSKENPKTSYKLVDTCKLPSGDLPLDEYLESEDDEIAEYIELLEQSGFAYTLETLSNIQRVFTKLLSSNFLYKVIKLIPDDYQEDWNDNKTYTYNGAIKHSW